MDSKKLLIKKLQFEKYSSENQIFCGKIHGKKIGGIDFQ